MALAQIIIIFFLLFTFYILLAIILLKQDCDVYCFFLNMI